MIEQELNKGPEQLRSEVLEGGWCVSCGACVELCPYIKAVGDRVAVIHTCGLSDGNCYRVCPRTPTDYEALASVLNISNDDLALGGYRELCQARATDPECRGPGQYGGVVTALATLALEEGAAGGVLLTGSGGLEPHWTIARSRQEVIAAAGSKYGVCPGLSGLNQALRQEQKGIAVVGRPCQVTALRKMKQYSTVEGRDSIGFILGLFCFWGLDYRFYRALRDDQGVGYIRRADIPKDSGLTLDTDRGQLTLTLEETRSYIREGCYSCLDPTAQLADLSVGSTESDPGWCTLLARTDSGEELVQKGRQTGMIETRPAPEEAVTALKEAVLVKKRRVLDPASVAVGGPAVNSGYIRLAEETRNRIMEEGA